ncbi:MAG TPA: ribosome-associated translation inhibitor RaiA [Desulfobacteraceae bacterium]|nr:ribosome-associated translation inhibitor RaiA [Desulfobacteraceae bacterium]
MELNITFRHMETTDSLRNYAIDKIKKLKKYLDTPLNANMVLSVEKFRHIADVSIYMDGAIIRGVEETGDMYSAIDLVVDKLEKQIKKHRSKIRQKRGEEQVRENREDTESLEENLIEAEQMIAKPMDPNEALMQLKANGLEFIVFRNSATQKINVLYRKSNNRFGLIEP